MAFIKLFRKRVPWSVRRVFGDPKVQINPLTNALATFTAPACFKGMASEYFVRKSCIVSMWVGFHHETFERVPWYPLIFCQMQYPGCRLAPLVALFFYVQVFLADNFDTFVWMFVCQFLFAVSSAYVLSYWMFLPRFWGLRLRLCGFLVLCFSVCFQGVSSSHWYIPWL